MSESMFNLTDLASQLLENTKYTKDIINNLDSFFLTINGSLIILMQVLIYANNFLIVKLKVPL